MQYLYLIKCQQYYKIGIANDVESRLSQLSTGNPFPLEVITVYEFDNAEIVERSLHQKYKGARVRGEWFLLGYDELKDLHTICLMLGGSAYEYTGQAVTEETIEEAEEIDYSLENVRTELRLSENGEPRGVILISRGKDRGAASYIGKRNPDFEKYLDLYKQEHPNSKVLK